MSHVITIQYMPLKQRVLLPLLIAIYVLPLIQNYSDQFLVKHGGIDDHFRSENEFNVDKRLFLCFIMSEMTRPAE